MVEYLRSRGRALLLPGVLGRSTAAMSMRTMEPLRWTWKWGDWEPMSVKVKLGVPVVLLDWYRLLLPNVVQDAPAASLWLTAALAAQPLYSNLTRIVPVFAGFHLKEATTQRLSHRLPDVPETLHFQLRENPYAFPAPPDILRAPLNLLWSPSPWTQRPLLLDLLPTWGIEDRSQARRYFESYVATILRGFYGPLVLSDICLEAHPQNLILDINVTNGSSSSILRHSCTWLS